MAKARWTTKQRAKKWRMTPSEADFQWMVIKMAKVNGWMYYFTADSRGSPKGFPDLVFVLGERCLFVELKVGSNMRTDEQVVWGDALMGVPGVEYYVWYDTDWDEIEYQLARRRC